ncbi:MAG: type II secretion system F family protein [Planctomycetota bacterium]
MLARRQIRGKALSDLCHRVAMEAESGIDIRRVWQREAAGSGPGRAAMQTISDGVQRGDTLSECLARTGDAFPELFREMVDVAEQTGNLPEVLHRLSDHYRRRHEMMRSLVMGLMWPAFQLAAAVLAVGVVLLLIQAFDLKRPLSGDPIDVLGFGVTGQAALWLYVQLVIAGVMAIAAVIVGLRKGWLWVAPVERLAMSLPGIGPCLQKICLAQLTWALHLMLNTEIDLRRLTPLALKATGSRYYTAWTDRVVRLVEAGSPLHEALATAAVFQWHFIDALQVAEESGQIVESMSRLSLQYEAEARDAMTTLTRILGGILGVGVLVVGGLIVIRLFQVIYIDTINDAINGF